MSSSAAPCHFVGVRESRKTDPTARTRATDLPRTSPRFRSRPGIDRPASASSSPMGPLTPFQLCIALIQVQRAHSQLLDTLGHARELQRRGLIYREGNHSNRQFVDAYLARQQVKIEQTREQVKASRARAARLIELADAPKPVEAAASERFSARFVRRRRRSSPLSAGSDRVRFQASPM